MWVHHPPQTMQICNILLMKWLWNKWDFLWIQIGCLLQFCWHRKSFTFLQITLTPKIQTLTLRIYALFTLMWLWALIVNKSGPHISTQLELSFARHWSYVVYNIKTCRKITSDALLIILTYIHFFPAFLSALYKTNAQAHSMRLTANTLFFHFSIFLQRVKCASTVCRCETLKSSDTEI